MWKCCGTQGRGENDWLVVFHHSFHIDMYIRWLCMRLNDALFKLALVANVVSRKPQEHRTSIFDVINRRSPSCKLVDVMLCAFPDDLDGMRTVVRSAMMRG